MKMLSVLFVLTFMVGMSPSQTPEDAANQFYSFVLSSRYQSCLPDGSQLDRLSPFMSKRLTDLLRDALIYRERYAKQHPPEFRKDSPPIFYKPPFSDGDCFSSNVEGVTRFKLGKSKEAQNGFRIDLVLAYIDSMKSKEVPEPFEWIDTIVVVREGDRFVVDDIEFGGNWPYGNHGSLSKLLKARD